MRQRLHVYDFAIQPRGHSDILRSGGLGARFVCKVHLIVLNIQKTKLLAFQVLTYPKFSMVNFIINYRVFPFYTQPGGRKFHNIC